MRRNLHILYDDKFTDGAVEQFEHHYPGQNTYVIFLFDRGGLKFTTAQQYVQVFHIRESTIKQQLEQLVVQHQVTNLFIHYLDPYKAATALRLTAKFSLKFYWIFYGADLYDYLQRRSNYKILDDDRWLKKSDVFSSLVRKAKYLLWFGMTSDRALRKAFHRVDMFCFWNEYDYQLFQEHFKSNAIFKPFIYYHALGSEASEESSKEEVIMINHSASFSGNHAYALRLLHDIGADLSAYDLLLPLSYGDPPYADYVEEEARQLLGVNVVPLRQFLPMDVYQEKLSRVKIAIFAMRRQEAAGNIFQLLNMGAKVFLREENSIFHWLKSRGFIVFSLDADIQELRGLEGLESGQIAHNRERYKHHFNPEVYEKMMVELING